MDSRRVGDALTAALAYLTDDEYRFEFAPHPRPGPVPRYLDFGGEPLAGRIDEVALYSGGLDSLAGAVDAAANRGVRALLVRHRSTEKWAPAIEGTLAALKRGLGGLAPATLTVDANKGEGLTRDANQRSRMFLYATLGSVAAGPASAARLARERLRTSKLDSVSYKQDRWRKAGLPGVSLHGIATRSRTLEWPQRIECTARSVAECRDCARNEIAR